MGVKESAVNALQSRWSYINLISNLMIKYPKLKGKIDQNTLEAISTGVIMEASAPSAGKEVYIVPSFVSQTTYNDLRKDPIFLDMLNNNLDSIDNKSNGVDFNIANFVEAYVLYKLASSDKTILDMYDAKTNVRLYADADSVVKKRTADNTATLATALSKVGNSTTNNKQSDAMVVTGQLNIGGGTEGYLKTVNDNAGIDLNKMADAARAASKGALDNVLKANKIVNKPALSAEDQIAQRLKDIASGASNLASSAWGYMVQNVSSAFKDEPPTVAKAGTHLDLSGIIGMPPTYSLLADVRITEETLNTALQGISPVMPKNIDSYNIYGRAWSDKYIQFSNLVYMSPGVPEFLPALSDEDKKKIFSQFTALSGESSEDSKAVTDSTAKADSRLSTLFRFKDASADYGITFRAMYDAATAIFGIDRHTIASYYDDFESKYMDSGANVNGLNHTGTLHYKMFNTDISVGDGLESKQGFFATVLYNSGPIENSENMSNAVGEPMIGGLFNNSKADLLREMSFLANSYMKDDKSAKSFAANGNSLLDNVIAATGTAIGFGQGFAKQLSGHIKIPKIWKGSEYGKQFNINIKLISPSGDSISRFKNLVVPLLRLMPYFVPRQLAFTPDTVMSPFLVQMFAKGTIACELGMVTAVEINRNSDALTIDQMPTEIDVRFTVTDLSPFLSVPDGADDKGLFGKAYGSGMVLFLSAMAGVPLYRADISEATLFKSKTQTLLTMVTSPIKAIPEMLSGAINQAHKNVQEQLAGGLIQALITNPLGMAGNGAIFAAEWAGNTIQAVAEDVTDTVGHVVGEIADSVKP